MQRYYQKIIQEEADGVNQKTTTMKYKSETETIMEQIFIRMIQQYDFLSVVMYPDLKNRREFVHDSWIIAKHMENEELKIDVSMDKYFYLVR